MKRLRRVVENELTPIQRQIVEAYFLDQKTMSQIAEDRGVTRSSVCRTLHRAIDRCRRCLKY